MNIEEDAGKEAKFSNREYENVGANVVDQRVAFESGSKINKTCTSVFFILI